LQQPGSAVCYRTDFQKIQKYFCFSLLPFFDFSLGNDGTILGANHKPAQDTSLHLSDVLPGLLINFIENTKFALNILSRIITH
jgi:hypothetical protein